MNELTFKMDVQLDDEENLIKKGTKVKVADTWRIKEGFQPVIITDALTYEGDTIQFNPMVEWFMNCSFEELS